ncbi:surface antigen-domain-containing protein [Sordaria brevicollis]|uniref:Surface antigen-domain-containing protein n=1 Tax=Sordaria brevicollis TaxID=83679 RepID=A0AAE0UF49_SORBR|nr:surface antigen-domain-containing protein [Sordaria brevicollis]
MASSPSALGNTVEAATAKIDKAAAIVTEPKEHEPYQAQNPIFEDHLLAPATVNSIEVHGANNTRRGLLDHLFKPIVEESVNPDTTLGDVLGRISKATQKLTRFGIFKEDGFGVFISDARQKQQEQFQSPTDRTELDVSIRVKEQSRLVFSAGTDFGNSEGSAYTNAVLRNIFGGAETLSVNAATGTRTRSAYNAVFSTPLNGNPDLRLALEGLRSSTQKPWASHDEHLTGGNLRLAWLTDNGDNHTLGYSGVWRQLTGLAASASPTVRADAGDSLKSSITHTFTRDRRDNPMLPQAGYLLRTVSELAGWGPLKGDVSFLKSEVEVSTAQALPLPGVSVGAGFRAGLLCPLPTGYSLTGASVAPSRINDRFQLGGPTDVRGFSLGGIGPHDGADSVGGDVFAAGSVNMLLPLPKAGPTSPLRLQLFANGGRLVALQGKKAAEGSLSLDSSAVASGMKSAVAELANGLPSIAAGFGLVYAHPVARFELNFSLPLVVRRGEEARKGLQVGVGINFL